MKNKFSIISDELIDLHEHLRKQWPFLLRVAVALYDKDTDILHTFIKSSIGKLNLNHYGCTLANVPSLIDIAKTKEARVVQNIGQHYNLNVEHSQLLLEDGFKSSFTIPIYLNQNLLGFIFFDSSELDYFSSQIQRTLLDYSRLIESLIISEVLPIKSLIAMVDTTREITKVRDDETGRHLTRMAHYVEIIALDIAEKYNISDEDIEYIWLYAPLHDIGKIAIADKILMKPGKLNDEEYEIIKTHVQEGITMIEMITKNFDFQQLHHIDILNDIVSQHHERLDGSGYPKGLKGDEISIVGKITAVADVFDALSSTRIYSGADSIESSFEYLSQNIDTLFDRDCVEALINSRDKVIAIYKKFT